MEYYPGNARKEPNANTQSKQLLISTWACIEEIINISMLQERFRSSVAQGYLSSIMDEIDRQSKVEFNYEEPDDEDDEDE